MPPVENETAAAGVDTPAPSATNGAPPDGDKPSEDWRNPEEIKRALKQQRELSRRFDSVESTLSKLLEHVSKAAPQAPPSNGAPPPSDEERQSRVSVKQVHEDVASLRAELAFKDHLNSLDVQLTREQRSLLDRLYKAERPADVGEWIEEQLRAFPAPAKTTPAAAPPPAPKVSDTGAPARDPSVGLGRGIFDAPPGALRGMSREELRARRNYELAKGGNANPWRR